MKKMLYILAAVMAAMAVMANAPAGAVDHYYYGRLVIGQQVDIDLEYMAFTGKTPGESQVAQEIVDERSKALALDLSKEDGREVALVISDHRTQGFNALFEVKPSKTWAEISYPDGSRQRYICAGRESGYWKGDVFTRDGKYVETVVPPSWVVMRTCNPSSRDGVTITYWRPVVWFSS